MFSYLQQWYKPVSGFILSVRNWWKLARQSPQVSFVRLLRVFILQRQIISRFLLLLQTD